MEKEMANNKRRRWVLGSIAAVLVIAVVVLLLLFGSCGRADGSGDPGKTQTDNWLAQRLAADGTDVIELNEDVELSELCYINGDKTITGSGTITMSSVGEYIIVINNGSSLTLAGPVLDGTGNATNGIYVSENASLNLTAGGLQNLTGHGIRVLGTADISGGSITGTGTNWVMVDTGAKLSVTGGSFASAGADGIITATGSEVTLGSAVSMSGAKGSLLNNAGTMKVQGGSYTDAGSYAFHNEGSMEVSDVDFAGATTLGYVENTGKLILTGGSMTDSKADFVYNRGEAEISNVKLDTCSGTAIETRGTGSSLVIKNCTLDNIGKAAILSRNSVVKAEDLSIGTVGSYGIHNRASEFTGKNISIENAAEVAVYNDFAQDGDTNGCGKLTLDGFTIGTAGSFGLRNNGGTMTLSNGTVGKTGNYALYAKKGEVITNKVDFAGTLDTNKAVVQIGLSDAPGGTVTMNETTITGGARGITNNGILTFNSGRIYGNVSGESTRVGAGISNNESGTLYLNGGTITGNRAASSGGGVYNTGTAVIGAANITGNSTGASGGGIANKGSMSINGTTVSGNYAANYGGGVFVNEGGRLTLGSAAVCANTAGKAGGGVAVSGSATISGGGISNNTAKGAGGGLYVGSAGSVSLTGGSISGNKTGSENSGGGAYVLGKLKMTGGSITNNTAGSYGGGISNATNAAGTAHGTLTISGGSITGNTCGKGGAGVYNSGEATIRGGSIKDNTPGTSGSAVYNSGTLSLTGGTLNGNAAGYEKNPYDLYIYRGTVSVSGSPDFCSVYKTLDGHIKVTGNLSKVYRLYISNYNLGTEALTGTTALISDNKDSFLLPADVVAAGKYISDAGLIVNGSYDPSAKEAELWRDGKKVETGNLVSILADAKDGDVVKLISDVELNDCVTINKAITITDDGTARTISFKAEDKAGIMTSGAEITIEGTEAGGLTLQGGESTSAGIIVNSDSSLIVSNVEVTGFHNTADSSASASMSSSTSGKNGAAFYLRSNSSAALTLQDVTITDCTTDNGGGAAVYNSEGGTVQISSSEISGCTAAGTYGGGAVYNAGSAAISESSFTGNSAACTSDTTRGDGGAVYNTSKGTAVITDTEITGNSATRYGGDVYNANALTVSGSDTVDALYLTSGSSATLGGELTGTLGIEVNDSDYVPNKAVLVKGSEATEEQLSAATEKVTVLNDTSETPALLLKEDGTLQANPAAAVEAFVFTGTDTTGEPAFKGSLVAALAEVQTGGTIVLQDDVTTTAAITMGDFTLDGNGKTLTLGASIEIGSAVTAAKVQNVTLAQTASMAKAAIYNQGVATLTSVTISGCEFTASYGGAVYNSKTLTVVDCVITNNTATGSGGGIFSSSKGTVVLSGSTTISGNSSGKSGNDVYNGNALTISGTVTVDELYLANEKFVTLGGEWTGTMGVKVSDTSFAKDRVIITKGSGTDAQLAAACEKITLLNNSGLAEDAITILLGEDGILCLKPADPAEEPEAYVFTGTDTTGEPAFKGSLVEALAEVQTGGTIVLQKDVTTTAAITMGDFTLDGNGKTLTLGASIQIGSTVTAAKVQNVTLAQTASMAKAAIYNQGVATLTSVTISGCEFTASSGGAVYNSKTLTVVDCVITNNTATASGGGIFNSSKGTVVLSGSTTVTGNSSGNNGNDVYNGNTLTISGTVTVNELYLANAKSVSLGGEWTGTMGVKVSTDSFAKDRVIITKGSATDAQLAAACEKITLINNSGLAEDAITIVLDADAASETLGKLVDKPVAPIEPEEPEVEPEAFVYAGTDTTAEPSFKGSFADALTNAAAGDTIVVQKTVTGTEDISLGSIHLDGANLLTLSGKLTVPADASATVSRVSASTVEISGALAVNDSTLSAVANNGTLTMSGTMNTSITLAEGKCITLGGALSGTVKVTVADADYVAGKVVVDAGAQDSMTLIMACACVQLQNTDDSLKLNSDGKLVSNPEAIFTAADNTTQEGSFADMLAAAQTAGSGTVVVLKPVTYTTAVTDLAGITITGNNNLTMTRSIAVSGTVTMNSVKFGGTARITNNGSLTLMGCSFNGISSSSNGAAINNAGTLTMSGGSITGCSTESTTGGGAIFNKGTASLSGVSISGCTASAGNGGGICNNSAGTLTLNSCTISGNTKGSGKYGPDVYNANILNVTGSTTIGELYLTSGKTIQVSSALTGSIKLRVANASYTGGATVLTGDAAAVAASAEKITLANADYMVDTEGKIVSKLSTTDDTDEGGLMTMSLNDEDLVVSATGDGETDQKLEDTNAADGNKDENDAAVTPEGETKNTTDAAAQTAANGDSTAKDTAGDTEVDAAKSDDSAANTNVDAAASSATDEGKQAEGENS